MQPNTLALPPFLVAREANSGNEAIQDFFLRWTIECADKKYASVDPTVHKYAKRIVYLLIHGQHNSKQHYEIPHEGNVDELANNSTFTVIKTHRQWNRIDLVAEIQDDSGRLYVLNIENKFYDPLRKDQLKNGKDKIEKAYPNHMPIHLVIYVDSEKLFKNGSKSDALRQKIVDAGYKFPGIDFLQKLAGFWDKNLPQTGNDLFDEYWFRKYR